MRHNLKIEGMCSLFTPLVCVYVYSMSMCVRCYVYVSMKYSCIALISHDRILDRLRHDMIARGMSMCASVAVGIFRSSRKTANSAVRRNAARPNTTHRNITPQNTTKRHAASRIPSIAPTATRYESPRRNVNTRAQTR